MLLLLLLLTIFITNFSESLIGVELSGSGRNCNVTLQKISSIKAFIKSDEWHELGKWFNVPCFDMVKTPNSGSFAITTKSDGSVFLTLLVKEASTLKITYLDPEQKGFIAAKKLTDKSDDCMKEDATGILPFLQFSHKQNGSVQLGKCKITVNEEALFDTKTMELDSNSTFEANHPVSISSLNAINPASNKLFYCTETGACNNSLNFQIHSKSIHKAIYSVGNYTILKQISEASAESSDKNDKISYTVNSLLHRQPSYNLSTHDFVYIFDEKDFKNRFFFDAEEKPEASSSNYFSVFHFVIAGSIIHFLLA